MTQEEKQLLLQDISARLPYDVKCAGWLNIDNYEDIDKVHPYINGEYIDGITDNKICVQGTWVKTEFVRPYLRPMGSMTEDEKKEFIHCAEYEVEESVNGRHYEYCLKDYVGTPEKPICNCNAIDWLLAHHFDFRGLIEMGLALPAKEGMY